MPLLSLSVAGVISVPSARSEEDFLLWEPIPSPSGFSHLLHVGAIVPCPWGGWPASRAFRPEPQPLPPLPPLPPPPPPFILQEHLLNTHSVGPVRDLARAGLKERTTQAHTQVWGVRVYNLAVPLRGRKCKIGNTGGGAEPQRGRSGAGPGLNPQGFRVRAQPRAGWGAIHVGTQETVTDGDSEVSYHHSKGNGSFQAGLWKGEGLHSAEEFAEQEQ